MTRKKIEIDLNRVEALAGRGLNQRQICDALGISEDTFTRRKKDSADFAESFKKGKAQSIAYVAGKLQKKIEDGDLAAIIFWLKCQAGWSEKQVLDVTTREEVPEGATALYAKIKAAYAKED